MKSYLLPLTAAFTVARGGAVNVSSSSSSVSWANLSISAPTNGRYLYRTASEEPFFWQADTAWELFHRLNRSDIDFYLRDRASKGFNVVQAVAIAELNGTTWPNFYGELPLVDRDPMRPNEAYFEHVDWAVNRAAEYGILIALVPTWGSYINCGWYDESWIIFNETSAAWYGQYIGARYPGLPKIVGADSDGFWSCNFSASMSAWEANPDVDPATVDIGPIQDSRPVFASLANGLREAEAKEGFESFIIWHPTSGEILGQPLAYGHNYMNGSFGRVSMDALQSGHAAPTQPAALEELFTKVRGWDSTLNYQNIGEMRAAFPGPVVDLENHYEGAHQDFNETLPIWNASVVRHGLWNAVLSGSAGFTYGAQAIWQMYAPEDQLAYPELYMSPRLYLAANESWRDSLSFPGSLQAGYLQKLFSSLEGYDAFSALQPDRTFIQNLANSSSDILSFEHNRYVAGLVGTRQYWVYTGYGDAFDLDLGALGAYFGQQQGSGSGSGSTASTKWYNPRTGEYQNVSSSAIVLSGQQTFVPPSGGGVDYDWALVLEVQ